MSASRPGASEPDVVGDAVGDRRLDGALGEVAQDARVVVGRASSGRPGWPRSGLRGAPGLHHVGELDGPAHRLADPAHALRVGVGDLDRAQLVERPLGGHRRRRDALAGQRDVLGESNDAPWLRTVIGDVLATAVTPYGMVGVVDEQMMFGSRTSPMTSGTWPPPAPSTW